MVQIYTGNGKGKTTAALGLSMRAAGAGLRVLFVQFMKEAHTSELEALKLLSDTITVKRFGPGSFILNIPRQEDFECALDAFIEIDEAVKSGDYNMVVADEICTALYYGLVDKNKTLKIMQDCPPTIELVFTGRYADDDLINAADLVTEMREIKYYDQENIPARKGIEY